MKLDGPAIKQQVFTMTSPVAPSDPSPSGVLPSMLFSLTFMGMVPAAPARAQENGVKKTADPREQRNARTFERLGMRHLPKGSVRSKPACSDEQKRAAVDHHVEGPGVMGATLWAVVGCGPTADRACRSEARR